MINKDESWSLGSGDSMEGEDLSSGSVMGDESGPKRSQEEEIRITFLYMGQGDCVLISCPDGRRILVDCGSTAGFTAEAKVRAHNHLRSDDGVGNSGGKLHALILTHPDADHYNQIPLMLGGFTQAVANYFNAELEQTGWEGDEVLKAGKTKSIAVDNVYFSFYREKNDLRPLGSYGENGTADFLFKYCSVKNINLVTINEDTVDLNNGKLRQWKEWKSPSRTRNVPGREVVVAKGTTDGGREWCVSIVAGGVGFNEELSESERKNAGSLVTLLELGGEKALLCGDATVHTEDFLVRNQESRIENMIVVQAPHHGSSLNCSSQDFVDIVNPEAVAVSVELIEYGHHLPGQAAITRYLEKLQDTDGEHLVDWWEVGPRPYRTKKANHLLDTWCRKNVRYDQRESGSVYIRRDQQTIQNAYVALSPGTGHLLWRRTTPKPLRLTGLTYPDYIYYDLTGRSDSPTEPTP